jgi:hypothetical protein
MGIGNDGAGEAQRTPKIDPKEKERARRSNGLKKKTKGARRLPVYSAADDADAAFALGFLFPSVSCSRM